MAPVLAWSSHDLGLPDAVAAAFAAEPDTTSDAPNGASVLAGSGTAGSASQTVDGAVTNAPGAASEAPAPTPGSGAAEGQPVAMSSAPGGGPDPGNSAPTTTGDPADSSASRTTDPGTTTPTTPPSTTLGAVEDPIGRATDPLGG